MLVFDRRNWPEHRPWAIGTGLVAVAAVAWCVSAMLGSTDGRWPGGGSGPGLVLGIGGGLICLFEMLLWPRKLLRRMRLGRTKVWMKAHLWLGVLALPLLLLHGGFRLDPGRSPLAVALMWSVLLIVASGISGGVLQAILPRKMLEEIPAETIAGQIERVRERYLEEARRLVRMTCGGEVEGVVTVDAQQSAGNVQGKVVKTIAGGAAVAGADALAAFHRAQIDPYLGASRRQAATLELAVGRRAAVMFEDIKARVPREAHGAIDRLADLCDQRRQFDRQAGMDRWLHGWLVFHFALSMAMVGLLGAHVVVALRYY